LLAKTLAPIATVSFCGGVRRKRFSEKREIASKKTAYEKNGIATSFDSIARHGAMARYY